MEITIGIFLLAIALAVALFAKTSGSGPVRSAKKKKK